MTIPAHAAASPTLNALLHAGGVLAGTARGNVPVAPAQAGVQAQLADLLRARLASARSILPEQWLQAQSLTATNDGGDDDNSRNEALVKLATAKLALVILLGLQYEEDRQKLRQPAPIANDAPVAPVFGSRDIELIQTLALLVARWGLATVVQDGILPPQMLDKPASRATRFEELDESLEAVRDGALRIMADACADLLLPPPAAYRRELQAIALPALLVPVLAAFLELASASEHSDAQAEDRFKRVLALVNPSTAMASLLSLLAGPKQDGSRPSWLSAKVTSALSQQLLRPGGVLGLLNVLLGRSNSDLQVTQLEHVARLLITPPVGEAAEEYLAAILPRIMALLKPQEAGAQPAPPSYIKALCFCLSRAIALHPASVTAHVLPLLTFDHGSIEDQIDTMSTIVANIDPSPGNYAFLIGPNVSKLLSMWLFVMETKGDPVLRESIENLLSVWYRTLAEAEVAQRLAKSVMQAPEHYWQRTAEGGIAFSPEGQQSSSSADILMIKPDPALIARWLQKMARPQVTSLLLVQWLDEIRILQNEPDQGFETQKSIIIRLQLVLKIIEECGSEIVKEAKQTLIFIDHALDSRPTSQAKPKTPVRTSVKGKGRLSLSDLKIVDSDSESSDAEETGEDASEFPDLQGIAKGEELAVTGLTLLLAVLEGNEDVNHANTPILHSISEKLNILADSENPTTARLARDSAMVLSLRKAAYSSNIGQDKGSGSKSRETYQEALKLLQDPILPIRAQGLAMLRSLVASKDALFTTDPALIPAVLDIFVQAVQDDDSFLYLNAIQGLSTMVDSFGKDIARRLMAVYTGSNADSVGAGEKGRRELDKRLRVGEALVQIAQRASQALPIYAPTVVPPLLHVIRTKSLPVALRSSAFTILAVISEASPLALIKEQGMLVEACLDLLSLESRSARKTKEADETPDPLEEASTHPSLRRGALRCIGHLLRGNPEGFTTRILQRMQAVLGYLVATDEDPLVRHNAEEVLEDCDTLMS